MTEQKKKIQLVELNVSSFVTITKPAANKTVQGGTMSLTNTALINKLADYGDDIETCMSYDQTQPAWKGSASS